MVAISHQLEQRAVKRHYYPGQFIPSPGLFVKGMRLKVRKIHGFDLVDVAGVWNEDEHGALRFTYVGLFQRDGGTLEAKAAKEAERLDELAVEAVVQFDDAESKKLVKLSDHPGVHRRNT